MNCKKYVFCTIVTALLCLGLPATGTAAQTVTVNKAVPNPLDPDPKYTGKIYGNGNPPDYNTYDVGSPISNTLNLQSGAKVHNAYGSYSTGMEVKENTVNVANGATALGSVYGGYIRIENTTYMGTTRGNTVVVEGGDISSGGVYGGVSIVKSTESVAIENTVTIKGGKMVGVYGGYATVEDSGGGRVELSGNTVNIHGGSILEFIYGGYGRIAVLGNSSAKDNVVNIYNSPDLSSSVVYGVRVLDDDSKEHTDLKYEGNTLNLYSPVTVKGVKNFQNYNFYLPSNIAAGDAVLTVTNGDGKGNAVDLNGTTVHVGINGGGSSLGTGDRIVLIDETGGSGIEGAPENTQTSAEGMVGISNAVTFDLSATSNQLLATVISSGSNDQVDTQLKSLSESRVAGLGLLNMGADMLNMQGIAQLRSNTLLSGDTANPVLAPFGVMGGSALRYDSGSHVDVDAFNLATGLGWNIPFNEGQNGNLLLGAFFEAGWGSYDSHNSFGNAASVKGEGDTDYYGGGILARYDSAPVGPGNIYLETSFRAGKVDTDYDSSDFQSAGGNKVDFDSSAAYYGIHAGLGYIWNIGEASTLDLNSKYMWTRQDSDTVTIQGDRVHFKETDSHRWRTGAKYAYKIHTENGLLFSPYAGANFEYEFDSKARATVNGSSIDAPDVKGGTGIGELGVAFKPSSDSGFSLDLGMQGYTGKREGVGGSLLMKFEF